MRRILALLAGLTLPGAASSQPGAIRASEPASCSVLGAELRFGAYDEHARDPLDAVGSIRYRCRGAIGAVRIGLRSNAVGTWTLAGAAGARLRYRLFLDPARRIPWGDCAGADACYTDTEPTLGTRAIPVYARIERAQTARATGAFEDSVTVTLTY